MDKEKLKAMELDEDVADIVEYLNDHGFKTLASCDGVFDHHPKFQENFIPYGYITFERYDNICDLTAYAYQKGLEFSLSTRLNNNEPHLLYNQLTCGDGVALHFENYYGENTQNMIDTFHEFIDDGKRATEENLTIVKEIDSAVKKNDDNSEIYLDFYTGRLVQRAYMKKEDGLSVLVANIKADSNFIFDVESLGLFIEENLGIPFRKTPKEDNFSGDLFSVKVGKSNLYVYFKMENYKKILQVINLLKDNEDKLKKVPKK